MSVAEPRQNALPQKYISTLWKGAVIGGTMLVPGVSGGSMAMILGIYQELISAVSSFRKQKKSNFLFLTVFCISAVFGMLVIATPISNLIDIFPKPTMYFFIFAFSAIMEKTHLGKCRMRFAESAPDRFTVSPL